MKVGLRDICRDVFSQFDWVTYVRKPSQNRNPHLQVGNLGKTFDTKVTAIVMPSATQEDD